MSRYNQRHIIARKEFGKVVKKDTPLKLRNLLDGNIDRNEAPQIVTEMIKYSGRIVHLTQDYSFNNERTRVNIQEDNGRYSWILKWFE